MDAGGTAWTRRRVSRVCALADAGAVEAVAAAVRVGATSFATVQEATQEVALMEVGDPTTGGSFYVGEVLITSALVDVDGQVGVGLVEFPTGLDVARRATERGLRVCVGAPNVLRARSHDGNLSARATLAAGAADVLCSDYLRGGKTMHATGQP